MIPVTHFVYLAAALFLIGLVGLVFRRSLLNVLMCAQLMLASAGIISSVMSRLASASSLTSRSRSAHVRGPVS